MKKLAILAASLTAIVSAGANAQVVTYYGLDAGAAQGDAHPNATNARNSFNAVAKNLSPVVTFESLPLGYGTGTYALGNGASVSLTGVDATDTTSSGIVTSQTAILGYNTTVGGTKYLGIAPIFSASNSTATATFTFASPINAFGAYLTGVGTAAGSLTAKFNDGSAQTFSITGASTGGILFTGFTDPNKSISSVSISEVLPGGSSNRDIFGIDDVVFGTVSAVPEPAAWAMMILGMGAVGVAMRRRVRASEAKFDAKIKRISEGAIA